MGIFDTFKRTAGLGAGVVSIGASPWTDPEGASLAPIVWSDILGADVVDALPMTRAEAITIPAASKGRNLLVSTIAKFPLVALNTAGPLEAKDQPSFLYRTDTAVTPYERMAWTVDDLYWEGYSMWRVRRGAKPAAGYAPILAAEWMPMSTWKITEGHVIFDVPGEAEYHPAEDEYLFFNSPFEGLLTVANRTLKGARDTENAWTGRARNPIPMVELHQTDDSMEPAEITPFVESWGKARRNPNGAIGYTPAGLEIRVHGAISADVMVESRNAVRTDLGSFINIRASMLDGTAGVDSLTYTTSEGERNSFYEFDLPFWTDPIEARLSMDDVVPRGTRIRFDKYSSDNPPAPTGPVVED